LNGGQIKIWDLNSPSTDALRTLNAGDNVNALTSFSY